MVGKFAHPTSAKAFNRTINNLKGCPLLADCAQPLPIKKAFQMKFEWDENKNQGNIRKHGVDFRQAVYVFADPFALSMPDDEHSDDEERWLLLGKNLNEQILLVVHTFRYDDMIRIISARKATQNEKATYTRRAK
ncbi:BrnT family toxin [Methylomonas sp. UP202]|uniref:BrnT family toxin n=1 Tax=unclassified Methylomonas TaxID=2608980 RepID=UPI00247AF5B1|nr:BrnT family toxin [Methylomonas sp. UP202]WGS84615.1 BrnT family toxin [Methylomonas sp. UP202]